MSPIQLAWVPTNIRTVELGGWIEIQEFRWAFACEDDTIPCHHSPAILVAANIAVGLAAFGIDLVHTVRCVPVCTSPRDPDPKTIGLYARNVICDG